MSSLEGRLMKMRMPKLSKAEMVMMLLNQWDPAHGADKDFRFYRVEAEEIAQKIRKNSSLKTVEQAVRESVEFRMKLENINEPIDEDACKAYAGWILSAIKRI